MERRASAWAATSEGEPPSHRPGNRSTLQAPVGVPPPRCGTFCLFSRSRFAKRGPQASVLIFLMSKTAVDVE